MNFLERIEQDMQDRRRCGDRADVSYIALQELLHHFNVLDSEHRATQPGFSPEQHLANAVTAAFHASNGSTEEIMRVVVGVLYRLTEPQKRDASWRR